MPQISPSPSRQLAAAALAFRRARRRFPKNLGLCACSGDAVRTSLQVCPAIARDKLAPLNHSTDRLYPPNTTGRRNNASYQSLASSRTALWFNDRRGEIIQGLNGCRKPETACQVPKGAERGGIRPTDSRESNQSHAYDFAGRKKRKQIRLSDRKASTVGDLGPKEGVERVYCIDSTAVADFPAKLQTWEQRTVQRSLVRRGKAVSCEEKRSPKEQTPDSSRNRAAFCKLHSSFAKKHLEPIPDADGCLRPSLIKAAQLKTDLEERGRDGRYRNHGVCSLGSKLLDSKSNWDENLSLIKHKDSLPILMERFRGNNKQQGSRSQNIYEPNPDLGSNLRSRIINGEAKSGKDHFLARKSSPGINPVEELGRVANQALRDSGNRFKNIRSRINKSGICCSQRRSAF